MASLKPSVRSKPSIPNGNGHHHETYVYQEDVKLFNADKFDPDNYIQIRCNSMSEKVHIFIEISSRFCFRFVLKKEVLYSEPL